MANAILNSELTIIEPSGHINASNAVKFQNQLATVMASDQDSAVLVDMQQIESLDSAGLMALVSTLSLALSLKRRFGICALAPSIRMIFELTQLDAAFEIFETREAFLATLKRSVGTVASKEPATSSVE